MSCDGNNTISQTDIDNIKNSADAIAEWVQGGPADSTQMPGGPLVPSPSKVIADAKLFKAPVAYSAATQYTDATQPVDEAGIIYAPLPAALPIGPEAFNAANWYVLQGLTDADIGTTTQAWSKQLDDLSGSLAGLPIAGLLTSNNSTDSDHDIDITAGRAPDSTESVFLVGTAQTKQIDATWAPGTNAGGMAAADHPVQGDVRYGVYLTDGNEYIFATSLSNALSGASKTYARRIGWAFTDASANIRKFTLVGDIVRFKNMISAISLSPPVAASQENFAVVAPPNTPVLLSTEYGNSTATGNQRGVFGETSSIILASSSQSHHLIGDSSELSSNAITIITDDISEISYYVTSAAGNTNLRARVEGYIDDRSI
jgi:hypothetical protein